MFSLLTFVGCIITTVNELHIFGLLMTHKQKSVLQHMSVSAWVGGRENHKEKLNPRLSHISL